MAMVENRSLFLIGFLIPLSVKMYFPKGVFFLTLRLRVPQEIITRRLIRSVSVNLVANFDAFLVRPAQKIATKKASTSSTELPRARGRSPAGIPTGQTDDLHTRPIPLRSETVLRRPNRCTTSLPVAGRPDALSLLPGANDAPRGLPSCAGRVSDAEIPRKTMESNSVSPMPATAPIAEFDKTPPTPPEDTLPMDDLPPPPAATAVSVQEEKKMEAEEE